jgi:o-succinylbenzoate synthase
LEGSIGLSAIAQFTGNYSINLPQGLGTGGIFSNNLPTKLVVKGGQLIMTV